MGGGELHAYLTLELDRCEWSASYLGHLPPISIGLGAGSGDWRIFGRLARNGSFHLP